MWCPLALLGAAILLQVVAEDPPHARAKRLTTFGKTPTTETETKIPRAKECHKDEDCAALEFTSCKEGSDHRKLCLCIDLQPPANGECATKRRELRQGCKYDNECIEGAECTINSTYRANEKLCYCMFGYVEEDNECNSGHSVNALISLVLFMTLAIITTHSI